MKLDRKKHQTLNKNIFAVLIFYSVILGAIYVSFEIYFFSNTLKEVTLDNGTKKILEREQYLKDFLQRSAIQLKSIQETRAFNEFVFNKKSDFLKEDFLQIIKNNQHIMQIRHIDKNGLETLRAERKDFRSKPIFIDENNLEDKSSRDYFINSKNKKLNEVFFSKLDLNYENNKLVKPYQATLRAILPLEYNKQFNGILIINYFMNSFLDDFLNDNLYDSILIDNDGYTVIHFERDKSWGRYKSPQIKISNIDKEFKNEIYSNSLVRSEDFVSKKFDLEIQNKIILILKLNHEYLLKEKKQQLISKLSISFLIILVSIVLIISISNILKKVILDFTSYDEYINLIDENIITSTTDLKGKIIYASKAFCKISGYSEKELLGKKHNIVKHPDEDSNKYIDLWEKLTNNEVWEGELKNRTKEGKDYWVKAKIYPIYEKNKKSGYTAIRQDITDKKIIEQISITDGLTDLYNRKHFDSIMPKILNNSKRDDKLISFLMIDVDNFKLYNDTYGHHNGDIALKSVANVLKASLKRSNDYAFRLGGEEFAITFTSNSKVDAVNFSKKIIENIEKLEIEHLKNNASRFLTVSIGLVCTKAKEITNYEKLYQQADNLLYKSKDNGRNRITSN